MNPSPRVTGISTFGWALVALVGLVCIAFLAFYRGENVNTLWMVVASICVFAIAYRFHSAWLMAKVLTLKEMRATPAVLHDDGKDYVPTNKWVVFGHHFAAIAGPGPLVGPVLAAQFGYLPGHAVDSDRRNPRRGRARLHRPFLLHPPRRQIARPDGA